ncbi:hypothetical protein D9M73_102140 [compost metagenome]
MKAAIPTLMTADSDLAQFASAVKQNVDSMTGQQKNAVKLVPLESTATLAQVITQLNAILERMQG